MQETYTIEEVAAMSMLSPRTIRNYLSLGLLAGEKTDGGWRFTPEQYSEFLRQDMVRQSVRVKANGMIYDFLAERKKRAGETCAIVDLPVGDLAAEAALRAALMEQINALGLRCNYHYDEKYARLILRGAPVQVARLLDSLPEVD